MGLKASSLFEILDRPDSTGAGIINTACDFGIIGTGHIDVMAVFIDVISRAIIPHHL
jgi:hypothetical protein